MKCFNGFTGETVDMPSSMSIHQMRSKATHKNGGGYWIVTDAQLKRDLAGRTLKDIYRENRAGRGADNSKYVPKHEGYGKIMGGLGITPVGREVSIEAEYLAWCKARNHTPHPASIDGDHPLNCHRLKAPKGERISPAIVEVRDYAMAA